MPAVLAGACVGEYIAGHRGKAERASSSSRYASKPASEVTTDPRNWSISRRSKSSLRTSPLDFTCRMMPHGPWFCTMMASTTGQVVVA